VGATETPGKRRPPLGGPETDTYRPSPRRITWIERLGPQCALGTDGVQWIVYKAEKGNHLEWQGETWVPVGYIQSSKAALLNCLEVKGLKLSPAGRAALERQDAKIYRWRRP